MTKPTFGSLFAGIGGIDLGLERAGWECRWQIENDRFCNRVLEERWPDVKRYGGVEDVEPGELEAVDLVCGGFPCQDLSVAGKRKGLSGRRSGLFWELVRVVEGLRPRWLLVENVPGFLSSNQGEDFALAIETLGKLGYGLAWRVLDSQYFGVPQRRRRVFIIGHLGAPCPPEVLFESEGGEGDTAEGGKAGEDVAYCLRERPSHSGDKGDGGVNTTLVFGSRNPDVAPTLRSPDPNAPRGPDGKRRDGGPGEKIPIIAQTLSKRDWRGHKQGDPLIAGFSAGQSAEAGSIAYEEEKSPTLRGEPSGTNQVPTIFHDSRLSDKDIRRHGDKSPTVSKRWGTGGCNVPYVTEGDPDVATAKGRQGRASEREEEPVAGPDRQADPLQHPEGVRPRVAGPALGRLGEGDDGEEAHPDGVREAPGVPRRVDLFVSENQRAELRLTPYARQLTGGGGKPGQGYPAVLTQVDLPVFRISLGFRNLEVQREVVGTLMGHGDPSRKAGINDLPMVLTESVPTADKTGTLDTGGAGSPKAHGGAWPGYKAQDSDKGFLVLTEEQVMEEFAQRVKQTVKHCLQCPDSPRYRALGNAVTVQVAEWIGRRVLKCHLGPRDGN